MTKTQTQKRRICERRIRYPSREKAVEANQERAYAVGEKRGTEYLCRVCGCWHTTVNWALRRKEAIQKRKERVLAQVPGSLTKP